mmetsp:Transcript_3741/g.9439  ORF Transcript_3741/g.9439 Transcript_3741/m.9439 type:complete len:339 (+) Transcript_3741:201-1217(+)
MEDYARGLARRATAQCVKRAGFSSASEASLGTLADVARRYAEELASRAHAIAEHANRTDANVADVLLALKELGSLPEDLVSHVSDRKEDPFCWKVNSFPAKRERGSHNPTFREKNVDAPNHIPSFLPVFPEDHTYKRTEVVLDDEMDSHTQWLSLQKQKHDAESALLNLQSRQAKEIGEGGVTAQPHGVEDLGNGDDNGKFLANWEDIAATTAGGDNLGGGDRWKRGRSLFPPADKKPATLIPGRHNVANQHLLSEADAANIKEALFNTRTGVDGLELSNRKSQVQHKHLQNFQTGGWTPDGKPETMAELDLIQRERIDRAERILKLGVGAAQEEEIL